MNRNDFTSDKRRYVKKLIDEADLLNGIDGVMDSHIRTLTKILVDNGASDEIVEKVKLILKNTFNESLHGEELQLMLIRAYEKHLTQAEAIEINEFVNDPKTKRISEKMRTINDEIAEVSAQWISRQEDILKPLIDQIIKDEAKRIADERMSKMAKPIPGIFSGIRHDTY